MKDWSSKLMIAILYTSGGIGYAIGGVQGVITGIMLTLIVAFVMGIGFLLLILREARNEE